MASTIDRNGWPRVPVLSEIQDRKARSLYVLSSSGYIASCRARTRSAAAHARVNGRNMLSDVSA